jgi:hypothetical protein
VDELYAKLCVFYGRYAPERLTDSSLSVRNIAETYVGREEALNERLVKAYGAGLNADSTGLVGNLLGTPLRDADYLSYARAYAPGVPLSLRTPTDAVEIMEAPVSGPAPEDHLPAGGNASSAALHRGDASVGLDAHETQSEASFGSASVSPRLWAPTPVPRSPHRESFPDVAQLEASFVASSAGSPTDHKWAAPHPAEHAAGAAGGVHLADTGMDRGLAHNSAVTPRLQHVERDSGGGAEEDRRNDAEPTDTSQQASAPADLSQPTGGDVARADLGLCGADSLAAPPQVQTAYCLAYTFVR